LPSSRRPYWTSISVTGRRWSSSRTACPRQRLADRIAVIIDGELVEIGPVKDVLERPADPRTKAFVSGDMVF